MKLLVEEPGSSSVEAHAGGAALASSRLAYVETCSALARACGGGRITADEHQVGLERFETLWGEIAVLEFDGTLADRAARLAERHLLRAYDAVHLASALEFVGDASLQFACFDADLREAARRDGLELVPA